MKTLLERMALVGWILALVSCVESEGPVKKAPHASSEMEANVNAGRSDREDRGEGAHSPETDSSLADVKITFPPEPSSLAEGFETREELFRVALRAIDLGDREILRDLLVDEEYYLTTMFPEFVKEKPALEGRGQFHWDHLEMKSLSGILDLVRDFGGRGLEFRLLNTESTRQYSGFSLHRHPVVVVVDPETKSESMHAFTNDIVEVNGKYQLLAYPN